MQILASALLSLFVWQNWRQRLISPPTLSLYNICMPEISNESGNIVRFEYRYVYIVQCVCVFVFLFRSLCQPLPKYGYLLYFFLTFSLCMHSNIPILSKTSWNQRKKKTPFYIDTHWVLVRCYHFGVQPRIISTASR